MDSLGWMKFEHAIQALTDRASYYGKNEEGAGALHALTRIASSGSAPVLRALLANTYIPFRLCRSKVSAASAIRARFPPSTSPPPVSTTRALRSRPRAQRSCSARRTSTRSRMRWSTRTRRAGQVYLAEIAVLQPDAIHALLRTPNPSTPHARSGSAGREPACRRDRDAEPLLKDPAPEVVEAASEAIRRLRAYGTVARP